MIKKIPIILLVLLGLTAIDACNQDDTVQSGNSTNELALHIEGIVCELWAQKPEKLTF